jgi:hypothetical protein
MGSLPGSALLIGAGTSVVSSITPLTVRNDVEALKTILTHPGRCGYHDDRVKTLIDDAVTMGTAGSRFGSLAGESKHLHPTRKTREPAHVAPSTSEGEAS